MKIQKLHWLNDSGIIMLCPIRGRVLQVTLGKEKAFWNHPTFSGDWNIGGDRLWIGPEVDWNWTSLKNPDLGNYVVQEAMDPGKWATKNRGKRSCQIQQNVLMKHRDKKREVRIKLIRSFRSVDMPKAAFFRKHLAYQTDNELWICSGTRGQNIGLWSLLQVPSGGTMCVLCRENATFRDYFTPIGDRLWKKEQNRLYFKITGRNRYKIGISPSAVSGKLAYIRKAAAGYLVIFRQFFPQPWRSYCDVPLNELKSNGDAVQVYNDDGSLGRFGEMEYHSPYIQVGKGPDHIVDTNLTVVGLVARNKLTAWKDYWLR